MYTVSIELYCGDSLEVMAELADNSVDTELTDPPYGLEFMGKEWDHGVPGMAYWKEALRVAKPGAMLLAFGGTRTYHRLACAIEDAGWEIRDCMMWLYGSGFPKSLDVSKAIDKAAGAEREVVGTNPNHRETVGQWRAAEGRPDSQTMASQVTTAPATPDAQEWDGWGTALKPAWEPIVVAMKPTAGTFAQNALDWGVAGLWVDGGRVPTYKDDDLARVNKWGDNGWKNSSGGPNAAAIRRAEGLPTQGRWPANLILDETAAAMLGEQSGNLTSGGSGRAHPSNGSMFVGTGGNARDISDTGTAARFFYQAKASRRERWFFCHICDDAFPASQRDEHMHGKGPKEQDHIFMHPTQKPLGLMEYLCKLTRTPTGGVVLDPFMGTGTTGRACVTTGRDFIGIDKEHPSYVIAKRRIGQVPLQLPLFAGLSLP